MTHDPPPNVPEEPLMASGSEDQDTIVVWWIWHYCCAILTMLPKEAMVLALWGAICVEISSNHKISSRLNIQAGPVEIEINVGENTFKWQVIKIFTTRWDIWVQVSCVECKTTFKSSRESFQGARKWQEKFVSKQKFARKRPFGGKNFNDLDFNLIFWLIWEVLLLYFAKITKV